MSVLFCAESKIDSFHNPAVDSATVNVILDPPFVDAGADTSIEINNKINLHGSGTDVYGSIIRYEWDFDGAGNLYDYHETSSGDTSVDINIEDAIFYLKVTDDDGNASVDSIHIGVFPRPVDLNLVEDSTLGRSILLNWSQSQDRDFLMYKIYCNTTEGIDLNSEPDTVIKDKRKLSHRITGLSANTLYHIMVVTQDSGGLYSSSNEVSETTLSPWLTKSPMSLKRHGLTSAVFNNNIYVFGGYEEENSRYITEVEMYDPLQNSWVTKESMPTGRFSITSSIVDGKIYVIGGRSESNDLGTDAVEEYDPSSDSWSIKAKMPTKRSDLTASASGGKIYVFGGFGTSWNTLNTVEEYDVSTDSWVLKGEMPIALRRANSVSVDNKVYVYGGYDGVGYNTILYEYDPLEDKWNEISTVPFERSNMASCVFDDKIFIIGGQKGNEVYADVMSNNLIQNLWVNLTPLPTPLHSLTACSTNGKIYAIGGAHNGETNTIFEYDPVIDR